MIKKWSTRSRNVWYRAAWTVMTIWSMLLLGSCHVVFENAMTPNGYARPVPLTPYLGRWYLQEWLGEPPERRIEVDVSAEDDGLLRILVAGGEHAIKDGRLAVIEDEIIILSTRGRVESFWILLRIVPQEDGTLAFRELTFSGMRDAVEWGKLAGEILEDDADDSLP